MRTTLKISGAALLATGILLAQAPDPARTTMPGATTSSTQDRNNAAPGSMMNRSTPRSTTGASTPGETVTGYLVDASCKEWANNRTMDRTTAAGANTTTGSSTTTSAVSPSVGQLSPSDPTTAAMTQPDTAAARRSGRMRPSATEMANSQAMIEDQVNSNGKRVPDMPASTQLTWNKPPSACSASLQTTQFGIFSNGKMYMFDPATNSNFQQQYQSNEKMKMALSNGVSAPVLVTASGPVTGDTIHVTRIHRGQ